MKKKYLYRFILTLTVLVPSLSTAQKTFFYNKGIFQVKSKTLISSFSNFTNLSHGKVMNDGIIYYYGNFSNEGYFDFTKSLATGEVFFINDKRENTRIEGTEVVNLNKVTFDSKRALTYFDLKANLDIWGEVDFKMGIIKVDSLFNTITKLPYGLVSFMPKSKHKNSNALSFIDGQVEKVGAEAFVFPVGNKAHYRPATISAPPSNKEVIWGKYIWNDSAFFAKHQTHVKEIKQINTTEYWKIEKATNSTASIILTLSWDEETTLAEVLSNVESELHIVYWNPTKLRWEDVGGVVDIANKSISTPTNITDFGYFTLATVTEPDTNKDGIIIYNFVNANGGDENDYFRIENITKYPKNTVQIYNRWGAKVYETKNYNHEGNVFKGYQSKGGKLQAGTYYYLITYETETKNRSYTVKKTGYLHLDTK